MEDEGGTVGNEGVTFHLTDTDTTSLGTTLDGLAGQRVHGTGGTDLELVVNHVTETLVVDDTDEDIGGELFTGDTTVEWFVAVVVVACLAELVAEVISGGVLLGELEGCRVLGMAVKSTGLASH